MVSNTENEESHGDNEGNTNNKSDQWIGQNAKPGRVN